MTIYEQDTKVRVMLATALPHQDGALSYLAASELEAGQLVTAPLGRRQVTGMVLGAASDDLPTSRLKPVRPVGGNYTMPEIMRRFIPWLASWYMEPPGAVLKMATPVPSALEAERMETGYRKAASATASTARRKQILDELDDKPAMSLSAIRQLTGASATTIKAMLKDGLLDAVELPPPLPQASSQASYSMASTLRLTPDQRGAADTIITALAARHFAPFLLDGVTGSGKTEIYFEAVAAALEARQQVLILLPEIALSAAFKARFAARFGAPPLLWHSGLGEAHRRHVWRAAISGQPIVVAGARSALMLPFAQLGLIVVDEEHDTSYRQEDGVRYHARDMAVVRAQLGDIPLVLASATPSLESIVNSERGKYQRIRLPERIGVAGMPKIKTVDVIKTPPARGQWLTPPLIEAIRVTLKRKEQTLLFLNRRGYAPVSVCRACRYRLVCPNCSTWLVTHKAARQLRCHHCGHACPYPEACPNCAAEDALVACGPGVERLAEEVSSHFPDAGQAIFSSDVITSPATAERFIKAVQAGKIDIIIGTQMIAKGHHFPDLTLVGVVDADLGLSGGDLRGAETSWQLLTQVAGRAGRADKPGLVVLQTALPDAPVLKTVIAGDRDRFIAAEKEARAEAGMPPFGRLAALILSGQRQPELAGAAANLRACWPGHQRIRLLGPAPAPLRMLRGQHRMRFLLKAEREVKMQRVIRQWLDRAVLPRSVRCRVDIDPISFL